MNCITLTGDALLGIAPALVAPHLMTGGPQQVCMGRIRPKARPASLRLSCYFSEAMATNLPASTNWREKAAPALQHMYLNDRYGDCVFAGKAHALGIWSANDPDSPGVIIATDAEIKQQYFDYTGGRDTGANIADVLDIMRSAKGFTAGGKKYTIDSYVSVDWTKQNLVKAVQALLGASTIGINLPSAWTQNAIWDVTNTGIVGGHDVTPIDYDDQGVYVSSWGRVYLITWRAFLSTKWLEEYYAILAPSWYNRDGLAPNGIDVATLKADLAKLAQGVIPDVPDPDNPPATETDWFV